ncbi:MAG TPA: acetyl-CoA carboxylase biotin carboxyl carrier protein subunit [Clostridiaceae bacterium]|jgi:biotin carboxyl carrier protein|nr:acetyl-CoA carboxylase biotin carboxyl carrier protein subunit [Clostridiaceae bacterium]
MKYVVRINNKDYEVVVEKGQANLVNTTEVVAAPAAPIAAAPAAPVAPATPAPAAAPQATGSTAINSPMPGTILDVKTSAGQSVKSGEVLVILEAMKMENEIVAPRDGVIAQIAVNKGASVSTGDLLISLQ